MARYYTPVSRIALLVICPGPLDSRSQNITRFQHVVRCQQAAPSIRHATSTHRALSTSRALNNLRVFDQRKCLLHKSVGIVHLVDRIVQKISCRLFERVSQIVELFSMMLVVIEHIFEERECFFGRRNSRVSVRMHAAVSVCMRVAMTTVFVCMFCHIYPPKSSVTITLYTTI